VPTDKSVRTSEESPALAIRAVLRARISNLYGHIFSPRDNPCDGVSLRRGDGGVWLCVVKRLNTSTGEREVVFGHGADFAEALVGANKLIAAGKWVIDKPWPR